MPEASKLAHEFRTMRWGGFSHVRNSLRIARLLSTALLMKPLCACANGAEWHSAVATRQRLRLFPSVGLRSGGASRTVPI
jgi:hypothetical protein